MRTQSFCGKNLNGEMTNYEVNKMTFNFDTQGKLQLAQKQQAIVLQDQFYQQAHNSSIHYAEESMPFKQGGEILLIAKTELRQHPQKITLITKQAQQRLEKNILAHQPRCWQKRLMRPCITSQQASTKQLALRYENAFGGEDYTANPVGQGFVKKGQNYQQNNIAALEYAHDPIRQPQRGHAVAGFNAIARHWQPRLGLYPQTQKQLHLYPDMHNVAPLDQRLTNPFRHNDEIIIKGINVGNHFCEAIRFCLPQLNTDTWDTVIIDAEQMKLFLLNRVAAC